MSYEGYGCSRPLTADDHMRDAIEAAEADCRFQTSEDDLQAHFLARRAYIAGQRSMVTTVLVTAENIAKVITMANALQKAARAKREALANPNDHEIYQRAVRKCELYRHHRAELVEMERARRKRAILEACK